jgi:hypothetical protein
MSVPSEDGPLTRPDEHADDPMPVFVIKAKDNLAPRAIEFYCWLLQEVGLTAQEAQARLALAEVMAWRERNPGACKWPDHMHVPVR